MHVDLAINPFDADVRDMVELARAAERRGISAIWSADHVSGAIVGRSWSRDPFVCLGAIASATDQVDIGVLVANIVNRHPVQLASAVNTLQSLAPGRVRLGIGSGAAPGSRFAAEHEALGRRLGNVDERRRHLVDQIGALRALWDGRAEFTSSTVGFDGLEGVIDASDPPPLIVGASSWGTIEVALEHADGVNVRATPSLDRLLARLARERPADFEVSVLEQSVAWAEPGDALALRDRLLDHGVDRLIVGMSPPHAPARLDVVDRLRREGSA